MSPLEELARSIAMTGGLVHQTYAHMEASIAAGRPGDDAPPPPIVLFQLLVDILEERLDDVHDADLATAAQVIDAVGDAMEADLYFVAPEEPPCAPNRAARRARSRRRCR